MNKLFRCKVALYPFELNLSEFDEFESVMPGGSISFTTHPTAELSQAFMRVSSTVDELTGCFQGEDMILTFAQLNKRYASMFTEAKSEFMTDAMLAAGDFAEMNVASEIASYWFAASSALNFDFETLQCDPPHIDAMAGRITIEIYDSNDSAPTVH